MKVCFDYQLAMLCWAVALPTCWAQAPDVSDPSARLVPGFDMPGEFPTTVTSANINVRPLAGVEFDGAGEDFLETTFPSAGPIAWTSSRNNAGDLSVSIGPLFPENPLSYPPSGFVDNFQAANTNTGNPINTSSNDLSTLAWRVGYGTGALLATTRHNGVDDGYTRLGSGGAPVGTIYGTTYFNNGGSQGWGFRVTDGVFANGGGTSSDLQTGAVGFANGAHEASYNVAAAYFPYEEGWVGAWVAAGSSGGASFQSAASSIDASTVTWNSGVATITLPQVDSASDGMLFIAPTDTSSTTRLAAAYPNGAGGWNAAVRLDEDADTTGQTILTSGNSIQFLYVPYDATNLVGGYVDGSNGSLIGSAGDNLFDLTRTSTGSYSVSIFEADGVTKKNEDDGMFILSVADTVAGNPSIASRAFISYEFDTASGNFVVETRELLAINSPTPDDGFGNQFGLVDTDFYFAWVDFETPLSPPSALVGDYNGDGLVDAADYTVWRDTLGSTTDLAADGDGSGAIDAADYSLWRQNFGAGASSASLAGAGAVPEPASLVFAIGLLICGIGATSRRLQSL
jgi:hypothetical protein